MNGTSRSVGQRNHAQTVTFADEFSGIGAFRLGFELACGDLELVPRCVHACEIDPKAAAVYRSRFHDPFDPIGDIEVIADQSAALPKCDVLIAGFCCQDFSSAGRRKGLAGERGRLFFALAKFIGRVKPRAFILENVRGLASHDKGRTLATVLGTLKDLGYSVRHAVLNSRDFGVPQNRPRIYFVGFLGGGEGFTFPSPTDSSKRLKDILERDPVDVSHFVTEHTLERMRLHKARHEAKGNGFGVKIIDPEHAVAGTLTSSGWGQEKNLVVDTRLSEFPVLPGRKSPISRECVRRLTPVEWERLQGLPDGFTEGQSVSDRFCQLGNAVTVPVIRAISRNLLAALGCGNPDSANGIPTAPELSGRTESSPSGQDAAVPAAKGFRFVDLFCGLGGIRLAMESLGGKCVMSSEIDKHARLVYQANFKESPSGDITKIDAGDVPDHDILCGGFPCPSWSICGKRKGFDDPRGMLFFEIIRILKERKPAAAFLENVKNLVSHDKGRSFAAIRNHLEDAGYTVFWQVLNSSRYGVPTARKRIYIVCFRKDLGIEGFSFPEPSMEPVCLADILLPDSETDGLVVSNHPVHIDEGKVRLTEGKVLLETVRVGRVGDREPPSQGNRIYSANGHAVTFCATAGGIGGKTGLYLVNGRVRRLAPRECLRVMGFDDSFVIPDSVSAEQVRRLAGNSVAVPVVRAVGAELIKALGITPPSPSKEPSSPSSGETGESKPASARTEGSAKPRVLGLFAGCGSLDMGFEQAGFEVVAANEFSPAAANTYRLNHPGTLMVEGDITLDSVKDRIASLFPDEEHRCDVIIGGPPCGAYSMSGHRDPSDPRGRLFEDYLDVVSRLSPSVVVIENVLGILSCRPGEPSPAISRIVKGLAALGYHTEHRVLNSADYGVPQCRRRVIILAAKPDVEICFPPPTHAEHGTLFGDERPWVTVRNALRDLEGAPENKNLWHVFVRSCPEFLDRVRRTLPGKSAAIRYREVFQRLWADRPSVTVKGSNGGLPIHYAEDRVITPREMARLQGFPDSFRFLGTKKDVLLMVGNAVPVQLARAVAIAVRGMLGV